MTRHSAKAPQFFLTSPAPCPYLEGQFERKVFTHLIGDNAGWLNNMLTHGGFRRSQNIAYRPACQKCSACVSVRVLVDAFTPSRSQRRVIKANADLRGRTAATMPAHEHYSLFRSYIDTRHHDGGMADMTVLDFAAMVEDTSVDTRLVEYRINGNSRLDEEAYPPGTLAAVALTDILDDGLSMIYSFFDPDFAPRSLGTYMILDHIEQARAMGLPYVYLGYWVNGSQKMTYKSRFLPQQHLTAEGWRRVDTPVGPLTG